MEKSNAFYLEVVGYIRKNYFNIMRNGYLTGKQKLYLSILAPAPKFVRKLHAKIRGL